MKRNTYQKLLLSLAMVAFFATLASAQVMNRSQVAPEMIELKKKAKEQGLSAVPAAWVKEAQQARAKREGIEQPTTTQPVQKTERRVVQKLDIEKKSVKKAVKKPNVERKLIESDKLSLREKARQINEKLMAEGDAPRASIIEIAGKRYIQMRPKEQVKFETENQ